MYSVKKQHYGFQVSLNLTHQVYHIVFMVRNSISYYLYHKIYPTRRGETPSCTAGYILSHPAYLGKQSDCTVDELKPSPTWVGSDILPDGDPQASYLAILVLTGNRSRLSV